MTRADALRNRDRVIAAAREVFSERGMDGSVTEIATRAGVGKATVYRSFPTKDHLIAAILAERIDWFEQRVRAALEGDDAGEAFRALLVEASERQARDQGLAGVMAAVKASPELQHLRVRAHDAMDALVRRGQEHGALRPDATGHDVRVMMSGTWRALRDSGATDAETWRRYGALLADAFIVRG